MKKLRLSLLALLLTACSTGHTPLRLGDVPCSVWFVRGDELAWVLVNTRNIDPGAFGNGQAYLAWRSQGDAFRYVIGDCQ